MKLEESVSSSNEEPSPKRARFGSTTPTRTTSSLTATTYLNFLRPTLDCSAIQPCRTSYHNLLRPTLDCSYWIVQPSYLIVPHHTLDCSSILPYPTPSYHNLLRPTLDCSAILPYRALSYILPHPTLHLP